MPDKQMKRIGEFNGVKYYLADETFENPGIYYWNGECNVNLLKEVAMLTGILADYMDRDAIKEQVRRLNKT